MAEENGVVMVSVPAAEGGLRKIAELRVVDLKAELKKRNLDTSGNKSSLMERLRQVIQEEGGNPDDISTSPETPSNRTSKSTGKGSIVDSEAEGNREGDCLKKQKPEETTEDAEMLCAMEFEPTQVPEVIEKTKVMPEEASIIEDIDQKEVEGALALGVENDIDLATTKMEIDSKTPAEEAVDTEKIDTRTLATENASKIEGSQQEHEVEEASIENAEQELQPRTEENKDEIMKQEDEGSDESAKKDPSIVEGSDQNQSSVEDENDNETNLQKGQCGKMNTGKNLLVSGLSADTRANELKNLFRKYGKVICAKVVTDARNPGQHYYGFITMSTVKEATKCITTLNQTDITGHTITVEPAKGTIKKRAEAKGGRLKHRRSTVIVNRSSRDKSSSNGKSQEDSKKRNNFKRSRCSERKRSRERKRASRSRSRHRRSRSRHRRSRSRHRRSSSRDRRRDRSIEKLMKLRELERHWDRKKEIWEIERRREREAWERETRQERDARKMLERELEKLQLERMRLEKERLQREALETQKFLLEGETRREQKLLRKMHEENTTRSFVDLGHREAYEREIQEEQEVREILKKELERLEFERLHQEKDQLERDMMDRKRLFSGGETRRESERYYQESSPGPSMSRSCHHQHNPNPHLSSSASSHSRSSTIGIQKPHLTRHLPLPTPSQPLPSLLPTPSGLGTRPSTGLLATPTNFFLGPRFTSSRPTNPMPPYSPPRPNAPSSGGSQPHLIYL
uniref:scaffold attachment factor B2-like isoform X2 n=1 Tax=Pristiophorus japonicus TaxID=55135 RepID=UPI00398EA05A